MKNRNNNFDLVECDMFRTLLFDRYQSAHIWNSKLTTANQVYDSSFAAVPRNLKIVYARNDNKSKESALLEIQTHKT